MKINCFSQRRIFARLNPPSIGAIPSMIHKKAKTVGGIFAGYAVFWWLTVLQVKNEPEFESIFFGPDFLTITILAPCLIFSGSLLSDFSRELGQVIPWTSQWNYVCFGSSLCPSHLSWD